MIDLNGVKERCLQQLNDVVNVVAATEMPTVIEHFQLTTSEINDQNHVDKLAAELPKEGYHVYWFEVDKPSELLLKFSNREGAVGYKLARDNKGTDSKYVYVGSCTKTKLSSRFKQHCGWGHDQTYALQLRKWLGKEELAFTFSYVKIENSTVVQYIEDQLHRELKPLFGKPGGNDKLPKTT